MSSVSPMTAAPAHAPWPGAVPARVQDHPADAATGPLEQAAAKAAASVSAPAADPLLAAYAALAAVGGGTAAGDAAGLRDFLAGIAEGALGASDQAVEGGPHLDVTA